MRNAIFFLTALAVCAFAQPYDTWGQHRTLWLNTSANGAAVAGDVTKFPVLVRLGAADSGVFTQSAGRGADLRFTKTNDVVRLPHEIERWDSAGRAAAIWVLVDSIKGGDRLQTIRMHWAKAGALDSSDGKAVFDTANGFQGVWHFNDAGVDSAFDVTANGFKLARQSTSTLYPLDTAGLIGRGRFFQGGTASSTGGSYQGVNTASGKLNFPDNGTYTVSAWANVNAIGVVRSVVSKGDGQYNLELRNAGVDWWWTHVGSGGYNRTQAPATGAGGAWVHLAGVRNGTAQDLYINGALADNSITVETGTRVETFNLTIGRNASVTNTRYFLGTIDEVNIAGAARGADWIKLSYENQKAAQTLVWLTQPPVAIAGPGGSAASGASLSVRHLDNGLLFRIGGLSGTHAAQARLTLVDMRGNAVWNANADPGSGQAYWNGEKAAPGVYALRVRLVDAHGKVILTRDHRVPFTR